MPDDFTAPEQPVKKFKPPQIKWHCPNEPEDHPTRLQQISYGHIENGEFVADEKTGYQCVWCHAVYTKTDIKA